MKWLLIILMLAGGPGFGQARPDSRKAAPRKPEAPTKWPIETLLVDGNHIYTADQILAVAGLKLGQLAGKEEFDAARDRLVASGAFETVGYKFEPGPNQKGYVATFEVTEVEPAYPVRFEALGVPAAELDQWLRTKDPLFSAKKMPATKPVLDRYVAWIEEYVSSKGNSEKLTSRLTPIGTDQFEIVFRPARNYPSVAQVTFDGNKGVPQGVLRDAIGGVAVGQPYTEERFRELLNTAVRPAYEARGYLRVKFTRIRTEPTKDVQGLHVFVTVEEGDTYQLSKVSVDGPSPLNPDSLIKTGGFKTDEAANFDQVNEGLEKMRQALRHDGYLDAKLTPNRVLDDAKKTVQVGVRIDPGPRYAMGKLTIAGLDLNGEFEMRRIWTLKEGSPFNPDYPQFFLNRVREEALFDNLGNTKSDVNVNQQDHTADVTLTFAGATPPKKGGRGRFDEPLPPN
ncbi:MAG TPA: POTRA domain-containing protein [Bryobacteraceae bacterium]|nr:POTRA domain-containing protein [Bryobacteraceae bacterium]